MSENNISYFPATTTMTVDQALERTKADKLTDVLIIGWDADAHLIAAAPEMYDILLDIAGYKLLDGEYPLEAEILDKMADVMAKIRGEE